MSRPERGPSQREVAADRGRVLMVDDRPDNLLALEAVLEPLDAELVRAGSGEEALRHLLGGDYAVIVLDVQMPGMDGFETARLIKAREKTRYVPIIFLTAISGEAEHHRQGYRTGAVDYVYKPFDPEALRTKVGVFLSLWRQGQVVERQRAALSRQLAEVERLNRELERSNAALERFAAAAAVEIQEPLDNVAGLLDLLAARYGDAVGEQGQMLVDRAEANLARVREQVGSLLELARAAVEPVSLQPLALPDVVAEAAGGMAGALEGAGARVVVAAGLPPVRGDRPNLVKLFRALIDNAVGHSGVRPLTISVDAEAEGGAVTVTVADDGNGFAPDVRPRLFTLLPANANGSDRVPAGLATCRRIVEGHGGTIWAEPVEGRGAVVRFTLPAG